MYHKMNTRDFVVLEICNDKYKAYRPCWAGWSKTFCTRKAARKAMAEYVNDLNGSKRGDRDYVKATDNSGGHDGTTYVVCNTIEAQTIMDSRYHRSYKASLPWWASEVE